MNLITTSAITTMSSREMADLTEKRHDNVKRTIDTLAENGTISHPQIVDGEKSANGVIEKLYLIGKRDSYIVVAQLSPEFTARLVDRWQELENLQPKFDPAALTRMDILKMALDSEERAINAEAKVITLETVVQAQTPKVEALDRIATSDGLMCITDAAKSLQVQPKRLFGWLQQNQWIYRRAGGSGYVGYQNRIQSGVLSHKVVTIDRSDGSTATKEQVLVTSKGLTRLAECIDLH